MADLCHLSRGPAEPMLEIAGSEEAWARGLSQSVDGVSAGRFSLTLSPERRIVQVPAAAAAPQAAWRVAVAAAHGRIVDVTHAWQPVRIEGSGARALLERGIELDLDPRHFPVGHAAATLCARVPVLLHAAAADAYTLFAATSYAGWLMLWLETARLHAGLQGRAAAAGGGERRHETEPGGAPGPDASSDRTS